MALFGKRKAQSPAPVHAPDASTESAGSPEPVAAGPRWTGRSLRLNFPPELDNLPRFAQEAGEMISENESVQIGLVPDDLEVIDSILDSWHRDGTGSDEVAETLWGFGCLVGQIMVHNAGGQWVETPEKHRELFGFPFVITWADGDYSNPIGKVFKRLENGEEDNLPYFYRVLTATHGSDPT